MLDDYLNFGGNEIGNNARVRGYAETADCPMFWFKGEVCEALWEALGDTDLYTYANITKAPWYDSVNADISSRFFGVYLVDVQGVEDSTRRVNVLEGVGDGGVLSPTRKAVKEVRVRAMLAADGQDALGYGMAWLSSVLDPGACGQHGTGCGTVDLAFYAECPPARADIRKPETQWNAPITNLATNPSFEAATPFVELRRNLCTNPTFTVNTTGWSGDAAALAVSTTTSHSAPSSVQVTPSVSGGGMLYTLATTSGKVYTLSAWIMSPASRDAQISAGGQTDKRTLAAGVWTRLAITLTASGASHDVYVSSQTTTGVFYVDDVLFEQAASVQSNFDGSYADTAQADYAWTGTAHASASTLSGPTPVTVRTNLATNPSFETNTAATQEARRNWLLSPRMENSVTGWAVNGAGVTQTAQPGGTRINFASAFAALSPCLFNSTVVPSAAGEVAYASIEVTVPAGQPAATFAVRIEVYQAGASATDGSAGSPTVTIQPGQTARITSAPWTASATGVGGWRIWLNVASPGVAAGSNVTVRNAIIEKTTVTTAPYFDGSTVPVGDFTHAWTGTADASASVQYGIAAQSPFVPSWGHDGSSVPVQSTEWVSSGSKSYRAIPKTAAAYQYLNIGTAPLTVGKVYTALATFRMKDPQTHPTPGPRARSIAYTESGATIVMAQAPNAPGVYTLRITFTLGGTGTRLLMFTGQAYSSGTTAESKDVWWDDLLIVEGAYTGPYFDGSNPAKVRRNLFKEPIPATAAMYPPSRSDLTLIADPTGNYARGTGNVAGSQYWNFTAAANRVPVSPGQTLTFQAESRVGGGATGRLVRVFWMDAAGVIIFTEPDSPTATGADVWQTLSKTATAPAGAAYAGTYLLLTGSSQVGWTSDVRRVMWEVGGTVQPYFDGTTPLAGGVAGGWDGTANASPSYLTDPDFTYAWSGTANASASGQYGVKVAGVTPSPGAVVVQSTLWADSRSKSLRIIPTDVGADTYADLSAASLGLLPGHTYTALATARLSQPQAGTLSPWARRIYASPVAVDSGSLIPTTGLLAYHTYLNYDAAATTGALWLYNFATSTVQKVSTGWTVVVAPTNPVFSPDGTVLLFMGIAVADQVWTIWAWQIGSSSQPRRLTPTGRNEDPKWGSDGNRIYWKRDGDVVVAPVVWSAGMPTLDLAHLSNLTNTNPWNQTTGANEEWMPFPTTGDTEVYYTYSKDTNGDIFKRPLTWNPDGTATPGAVSVVTATPGFAEYMAIPLSGFQVPGGFDTIYTRWRSADDRHDQIYTISGGVQARAPFNFDEGDNSDPWPINGTDHVVFCATGSDSWFYELWIGDLSTGKRVALPLANNAPGKGDRDMLMGASYFPGSAPVTTEAGSVPPPNAPGDYPQSFTFTYLPGTPSLRLYNGASGGNGDIWWDSLLIVEGEYVDDYFDGTFLDSPDSDTVGDALDRYAWTGTADASTSTWEHGNVITVEDPVAWQTRVDALRRYLHDVGAVSGPLVTDTFQSGQFVANLVQFVLVAERPWVYRVTQPITLPPALPVVVQDIPFNLAPYPSAELASGTVVVAHNYSANPSVETDATGWAQTSTAPVLVADVSGARSTSLAAQGAASFRTRMVATVASASPGEIMVQNTSATFPAAVAGTRMSVNMWAAAQVVSGTAVISKTEVIAIWRAGSTVLRSDIIGATAAGGGAVSGRAIAVPATADNVIMRARATLASWSIGATVDLYGDAVAVTVP